MLHFLSLTDLDSSFVSTRRQQHHSKYQPEGVPSSQPLCGMSRSSEPHEVCTVCDGTGRLWQALASQSDSCTSSLLMSMLSASLCCHNIFSANLSPFHSRGPHTAQSFRSHRALALPYRNQADVQCYSLSSGARQHEEHFKVALKRTCRPVTGHVFCASDALYCLLLPRVVNLDPAAENFAYDCYVDVRSRRCR